MRTTVPSDIERRDGIVEAGSGSRQQRYSAAGLNAGHFDGPRDGQPVGIRLIVMPDDAVALLTPLPQCVNPYVICVCVVAWYINININININIKKHFNILIIC